MKSTIGLALASGLFLMVAGCATSGTGGAAPGGAAGTGSVASAGQIRNFNLEVKCPGVHYLKSHNTSDSDIMDKLQVGQDEINSCEAWAAAQPKGYVPPPPAGVASSAPSGAAKTQ